MSSIAIIGGTGALGTGLARRWAKSGLSVVIGSRELEKAQEAVQDLKDLLHKRGFSGMHVSANTNLEAAQSADIVVLTVPYNFHKSTIESIKNACVGKIVIDVTVPLRPPKVGRVQLPKAGSAGQEAQALFGDDVKVVSAFQNVAAHHLQETNAIACDVLVSGNDKEARAEVVKLVEACGMRGFSVGPIDNAAAAEALTSVLIQINKQFKCHAGIQITGLDQ